jgi:hypothetical protein
MKNLFSRLQALFGKSSLAKATTTPSPLPVAAPLQTTMPPAPPLPGASNLANSPRLVVLREERSSTDSRYLCAKLSENGNLQFEGQDIGDEVESILGGREYEWIWTVLAQDLPRLARALQADGNLLPAIKHRFEGDKAALLGRFLEENAIPVDKWSRIGD